MPIELYFSNQLDQLAEKFSEVLWAEVRGKDNILAPARVIVPNANLSKWLQLFLAGKNAIFMNVDFQYLEAGLWGMLADLDREEKQPQMMDNQRLKILLFHLLQHLDPGDVDLLSLTRYLYTEDGAARSDEAPRLWQLAEKLAHLFGEYEFHRTDMIRQWAAGTTITTRGMEVCQQQLYARLKRIREHLTGHTDQELLSTMEYAQRVFSQTRASATRAAGFQLIHFFGLSQISNFHLNLIGRLQDHYAIHIYTLNPCEAFWEDIKTPGEKRWSRGRNVQRLAIQPSEQEQGELFQPADHALLSAWGKPGREGVRLLCQLTDYDFNSAFVFARQPAGILQRIQDDILTLSAAADAGERLNQDCSLQIVACPGPYREVETIYNSILFNLGRDDTLQLTDIAILVPDMTAYKPMFDSVFNRRPRQIAYNLVDSHADIESIYGRAVLALLKLAAGRFSRSEVFDLILNPCFMQRWKVGPEEVAAWVNWTRELNIFHAFDGQSKADQGYPAGGNFTWQQGLERLRLSRIMAPPNPGDPTGAAHYRERVPFADVRTGDADLVEKFCLIIETLHQAAKVLNAEGLGCQQWQERFFRICDELIEIPEGFKGEAVVHQALHKAFDTLGLYDFLPTNDAHVFLDLDVIKEFIRANLGAISGGHGNYLTGGVTISALQPMRPIPFRIIYVLGMEEGRFPGRADQTSLDLRLSKRRIGDVSLPERNRYLFLEMLLAVRDKLYLSYVARDLQKDRLQQPCSVVNQLKRYVELQLLPPGQTFQEAQIPLCASSTRYLNPEASDGFGIWSDVMVNYNLADLVAQFRSHGVWEVFKQQASTAELRRVAPFNPDLALDSGVAATEEGLVEKITLGQLVQFLIHPVRYKLQRHLGLYDEEETIEDVVLCEDEPFFSEFPVDYHLKIDPLLLWIDACFGETDCRQSDPGALFDFGYDTSRRKNQTPEGAFGDSDRKEMKGQYLRSVATLHPILEQIAGAKQSLRAVSIGDPGQKPIFTKGRSSIKRFNPLSLTVQTRDRGTRTVIRTVELHGQLPWVWQDSGNGWHVLVPTGSGKKPQDELDKYVLGPVLFFLLCLAGTESGPWFASPPFTIHVAYRDGIKAWTYAFDDALAPGYINELVGDLLDQARAVWLPFRIVSHRSRSVRPHLMAQDQINDGVKIQFAAEMEQALEEEEDYLIRMVKPSIPADTFDLARRRFKIFFD